jgi:tetratricopeptide (TPR) repeat protein
VLEQAMKINQTIGAQRELLYGRLNLGLVHWRSSDLPTARHVLEQVTIDLAASRDTFARAAGLSYLALTLEQAGDTATAVQCFREAQRQFETLGVRGYALDAQVGLARCLTALGQVAEAQPTIESAWHDLCERGAQGAEFAVWAYVTCAQVFEALGHTEQAHAAIEAGYQELQARAAKISDAQWRASFLDNVPEHRTITILWQQQATAAVGL